MVKNCRKDHLQKQGGGEKVAKRWLRQHRDEKGVGSGGGKGIRAITRPLFQGGGREVKNLTMAASPEGKNSPAARLV